MGPWVSLQKDASHHIDIPLYLKDTDALGRIVFELATKIAPDNFEAVLYSQVFKSY